MAAFDNATVTIDTNEWLYTDQNGKKVYVTNGQTFTLLLENATGNEVAYRVKAPAVIALADGRKIRIDCLRTYFRLDANATAKKMCGELWIEEDNGARCKWRIRTATMDDLDIPTALTLTAEREDNPNVTFTLSAVTVAQ